MESPSTLLLVEDDVHHAELALRVLEKCDQLRVCTVDCITAARDYLRTYSVDLVLSDLKLPDGSGLDLLDTGIPVVVQTSHGDEARAVAAMKGGALDYCVKSPEMFRELPRIVERALKAARNLRERRRAETSLRESDARFRQLADNIPEAFWLFDLQANSIAYASPAWASVYGQCETTWSGRLKWVHPEDRAELQDREAPAGPSTHQFRILQDKQVRWIEERMFPVRDESGKLRRVACLGADMTERLELEGRLRQAEKMEAIGQLAGGVAHDFNNMLAAIMSAAEELSVMVTQPAGKNLCALILQASERAAGLTNNLLSFSRKGKVRAGAVDLHQVVREVVALLERSVDRRVSISTDLRAPSWHVSGDAAQLQAAILNLGINARDAMPAGGELRFHTEETTLDGDACRELPFEVTPGPFIVVSVRDSGSGIAPHVLPHIFEPFFTTKEVGKGTGMGLAAVYGAALEHRGAVTVHTEVGAGTEFKLYIPVLVAGPELKPTVTHHARGRGLVLLIDDEPLVLAAVGEMLRSLGYDVLTACGGQAAMQHVRERRAELAAVLCDAVMPGESGPQVLRRIAEISPGLPCILFSGYARDTLPPGDSPLVRLSKPVRRDELAEVLAVAAKGYDPSQHTGDS